MRGKNTAIIVVLLGFSLFASCVHPSVFAEEGRKGYLQSISQNRPWELVVVARSLIFVGVWPVTVWTRKKEEKVKILGENFEAEKCRDILLCTM